MNWNSSFATMVSHMQIPSKNGKENSFTKGKKEVGMATINGVSGFSLVELLPGRKRSHSSSCWVLPPSQSMRTPLPRWSPHSIQLRFLLICNFINLLSLLICNWDFCLLFFFSFKFPCDWRHSLRTDPSALPNCKGWVFTWLKHLTAESAAETPMKAALWLEATRCCTYPPFLLSWLTLPPVSPFGQATVGTSAMGPLSRLQAELPLAVPVWSKSSYL